VTAIRLPPPSPHQDRIFSAFLDPSGLWGIALLSDFVAQRWNFPLVFPLLCLLVELPHINGKGSITGGSPVRLSGLRLAVPAFFLNLTSVLLNLLGDHVRPLRFRPPPIDLTLFSRPSHGAFILYC